MVHLTMIYWLRTYCLEWYIISERETGKGLEGGLVIAEDRVLSFCGRIKKNHCKSQSQ